MWGDSGGSRICTAVSESCSAPEPQTAPDQNHWPDIIITDALSEEFDKDDDDDSNNDKDGDKDIYILSHILSFSLAPIPNLTCSMLG